MTTEFERTLSSFRQQIEAAQHQLASLGLRDQLDELRRKASETEFRVTVLGRFKRGKSTFINAMLGDRLLPSATLPCTSAVVEIRPGATLQVQRWASGHYHQDTWANFLALSSMAASPATTVSSTHWSLRVPSPFLQPGFVLVDTPGTDEDPHRHQLAEAELKRTDAAIVLLDATQIGSIDELTMIDELQQRVGLVIIGVNRGDQIPAAQRERALEFARKRVMNATSVPPERVLLLSGEGVLQQDTWAMQQMAQFRQMLSTVLLANTAGAKLRALATGTEHALGKLNPRIDEAVAVAAKKVSAARESAEAAEQVEQEGARVRDVVRKSLRARQYHTADKASIKMRTLWPAVVEKTIRTKSRWTSDSDPLFSPKVFATEIAEQAKQHLVQELERSVKADLQPIIEQALAQARAKVMDVASRLLTLDATVHHRKLDELKSELEQGAIQDAFGSAIERSSSSGSETTVATVVSAIVGYVIADVVLFYVLGVISGFLAPPLLIAAAVTGGVAYLLKGRDWVQDWVRTKIAETLQEELTKDEVVDQICAGIERATSDIFTKTARGYEHQFQLLITRLGKDAQQARASLAAKVQESTTQSIRAEEARCALQELRRQIGNTGRFQTT